MAALDIKEKKSCLIKEDHFEPVKVADETYGKEILFSNKKKKIIFNSNFHKPGSVNYESIEKIEIRRVNKRKLFFYAFLLTFLVIGVVFMFALAHLPRWHVKVFLKKPINKKEYISIRVRLENFEADLLKEFLEDNFEVELYPLLWYQVKILKTKLILLGVKSQWSINKEYFLA